MKLFTAILTVLFASVASAFPAVGDKVTFKGLYQSAGAGEINIWQELEVTAFNKENNEFTVVQRSRSDLGENPTQEMKMKATQLITEASIKQLMQMCGTGPSYEEYVKVPAGKFMSCVVAEGKSRSWYGKVPFGIIKTQVVTPALDVITTELVSYTMGK